MPKRNEVDCMLFKQKFDNSGKLIDGWGTHVTGTMRELQEYLTEISTESKKDREAGRPYWVVVQLLSSRTTAL